MNKSLLSLLILGGVLMAGGALYFFAQSESVENIFSSSVFGEVDQELREGEGIASSDDDLAADVEGLAQGESQASDSGSGANLFVSEEAALDAEMKNLETDMNALSNQDTQSDMNDLNQIQ